MYLYLILNMQHSGSGLYEFVVSQKSMQTEYSYICKTHKVKTSLFHIFSRLGIMLKKIGRISDNTFYLVFFLNILSSHSYQQYLIMTSILLHQPCLTVMFYQCHIISGLFTS